MEERLYLIQQLEDARAKMRTVLADIHAQMEIYPGWTIKHVIAHIAGWDDATISSLRAHAGGAEPATPAVRGIDFYNAQSVATREALSYEQTVKEWELAREQFKTALGEIPPEKFREPMLFPWGRTGTIAQLVEVFADHEKEHAEEIRNLLKTRQDKE